MSQYGAHLPARATDTDVASPHNQEDRRHSYFVASARAGARLSSILSHVKAMHVVVINAQLVVGRAGEEASGFEAISERLDGLSRQASEQIHGINREAAEISRLAARLFQAEGGHVRFKEARRRADAADEAHLLDAALATHDHNLAEARRQARSALDRFEQHLKGIEGFLEAANHLAINARVEAAKTTEFRAQFEAVADHIQRSVTDIRAVVEEVREDVADLQAMRQDAG